MKKTIKHVLSVCLVLLSFVLIFTSCGQKGIKLPDSEGLAYSVNEDGISCTITGMGTCTDTEVGIPKIVDGYTVTGIGDTAFIGCTSLTSIMIPDSVTSIGQCAFDGCTSLTSITVEDGNSVYHSSGNCLIETGSKTLIAGCNTSVIPDDGSVTRIEWSAFSGCASLTSITIPDGVTSIGDYAFQECTSLTSITIPDSVTSIGYNAFEDCTSLTSITIPDSVTSIGNYAFNGCASLTSITIGDGVTSIGYQTFCFCTSLTSITMPDSVTSIGLSAFYSCSSLTSINYSGTIDQWNTIDKDDYWNSNTGDYVVHCTDGDISK